jgi:hypothetical protein
MTKTELALYLAALGIIAPHLSSWAIIAILLWLVIQSKHRRSPEDP